MLPVPAMRLMALIPKLETSLSPFVAMPWLVALTAVCQHALLTKHLLEVAYPATDASSAPTRPHEYLHWPLLPCLAAQPERQRILFSVLLLAVVRAEQRDTALVAARREHYTCWLR
jgi:hypothetical protein